ncbi:multidrug resistance pump, putative [Perkinsus marinus ATCC 50983]|uniref:Multidrug resistance pump, putative n=1 Tax=Perkinsus marinus (strain ATCC 50983 / TXsc) TaxID=423536 RepID=C5KGH6_PERM5|nr:multidrug resistance pump, putative [Perkinsus marinus ATCC 50983]EER16532.1 multidrug resistance pump, putative [Perkinsus marinus ATCC 50983]|eukprot:XP_002784736.1 multidrug resistance pump, putative [Perkinsus marinus ATCC 50983]
MWNPSITAIPRDALPTFTWSMFYGWWEYLKIGIPSMITLCSEWWAYEIATLIVGLLRDSNQLAAHVSICNLFVIMFMLSYGIQTGLSAKVGSAVGAGDLHLAKLYCRAGIVIGGSMIIIVVLLLCTFRDSIVRLYAEKEPDVGFSSTPTAYSYFNIHQVYNDMLSQ